MKEMFKETILKINDNLKALQALRESTDNLADKIALDIAILCNKECYAYTMHQHYSNPTDDDIAAGMQSLLYPVSENEVWKEYSMNAAKSENLYKQYCIKLDMLKGYLDDASVSANYAEYKLAHPIPNGDYYL